MRKGDFATVGALMADSLVWHQPGKGVQSGTYTGKEEVFKHLGNFAIWSKGSFAIDAVDYVSDSDNLVLATIHFIAVSGNKSLSMKGVDLFRMDGGKIQEIWLFSEKIDDEDDFWNAAAKQ